MCGLEGVGHDDGIEQTTGSVLTEEYTTVGLLPAKPERVVFCKCELPKMSYNPIMQTSVIFGFKNTN